MPYLHKAKRTRSALLALLMLPSFILSVGAQQASSGDSSPLSFSFTAIDKNRQLVTTLRREDVRVTLGGAVSEVADFKWQTDQSFSVIIMLDMSRSLERVIPVIKQASAEFVDSNARPGKDGVGIISFTSVPKLEQELTGNLQLARQAIERVEFKAPTGYVSGVTSGKASQQGTAQPYPGATSLWDSVRYASGQFGAQGGATVRRAVILITDGQDTSSKNKLDEAVEASLESGVAVYSIGIGDASYSGTNKDDLRKISERTGGRAFFPEKMGDLRAAFAEIEQRLRSRYLISLRPAGKSADGKTRKLKIELISPELRRQGLSLSYQQKY